MVHVHEDGDTCHAGQHKPKRAGISSALAVQDIDVLAPRVAEERRHGVREAQRGCSPISQATLPDPAAEPPSANDSVPRAEWNCAYRDLVDRGVQLEREGARPRMICP